MNKKQIKTWAREDTFRKSISRGIEKKNMQGIEEWIRDNVISKQNESIDEEAVSIFQAAQEELCKAFLRCQDTKSVQIILDMYNKFEEDEVHKLELIMIKNVVKSELDANLLLQSSKDFFSEQAIKNFGFNNLSLENKSICTDIGNLLLGDDSVSLCSE